MENNLVVFFSKYRFGLCSCCKNIACGGGHWSVLATAKPFLSKKEKTVKLYNKKLQAESEKTCAVLRSLTRVFFAEKPDKNQTTSTNIRFDFCPKPEIEREIEQKSQIATDTKTRRFLVQKPKMVETENPSAPIREEVVLLSRDSGLVFLPFPIAT